MFVSSSLIHSFCIWIARVSLMVTHVLLCSFLFRGAITVSTPCWCSPHLSLLLQSFPSSDTTLCNYPAKDSGSCLHTATAASLLAASILIESQVLIVKGDQLLKRSRSFRHIVFLEEAEIEREVLGRKDTGGLVVFSLDWFQCSVFRHVTLNECYWIVNHFESSR